MVPLPQLARLDRSEADWGEDTREVLEMIQTQAAMKHLETLATGAVEARLTSEAKAALARLRAQEKP